MEETNAAAEKQMTKEQSEAYNEFLDYMVELYHEFGHLMEEDKEQDKAKREPVA